jgi:hypothetical protein
MRTWELIQGQLEDAFSGGIDGVVGGARLLPVIDDEKAYGDYLVRTYHGSDVLTCSFFEFFIETLELAAEKVFRGQLSKDNQTYAPFYLSMFAVFRNFRAAEVIKNNGYPLDGYALLRDLKDRAIHLGAVVTGAADILALHGVGVVNEELKEWTEKDFERAREQRKDEQRNAMRVMVGSDSGLADEDRKELEKWRDAFHEEVHGSRFTIAADVKRLFIEKRPLPFGPEPHQNNWDASMYVNRSLEVAWMILRVFPFLQLRPRGFGQEWASKWELLDEAFRIQSEGLGDLGAPIGHAVIRFIDTKFPFSPDTASEDRGPDDDD